MHQNCKVIFITIFLLLLLDLQTEIAPFESCNDISSRTYSKQTDAMTFYYFAYGSNLLAKRIHINNPSASRVDIGLLEGYRLDFTGYSDKWRGAVATVEPTEGQSVWGAIWELDINDMQNLDNQEGVNLGIYQVLDHCVTCKNGSTMLCRLYQHLDAPGALCDIKQLPRGRMPSVTYLDTIREGAKESQLPADYIKFLFTIPDNGNTTSLDHLTGGMDGSHLDECK